METTNHVDTMFLEQLRKEVDLNLTNDQFSVEELARNIGMSRSQLHRKLNSATGQSVSQFIREYRLQLGMALLREGKLTAAEVSDRVGFGSATYFSKCFNEYYNFPPGEVKAKLVSGTLEQAVAAAKKSVTDEPDASPAAAQKSQTPIRKKVWAAVLVAVLISMAAVWFLFVREPRGAARHDKSIAILPFKNLSADKGNEYFSEGVIEAIRTSLSEVGELRVISRTSVEQYRDTDKPARTIANELGVSTLLEGSVQRSNNKVRIDVRLVDGASETQVWAESFDRELQDVFAIQHEIAYRVANELHAKLTAEERSNLSKSDTKNPEAYDLYLKAVYQYRTYTNKGAHNATDLLTKAIALDPNYAKAYAWLANSYISLASIWGAELSATDALQKGKPYIDKALALDLDQARMLMGFYRLYYDWDLQGAAGEYERSVKYGHPDALALYVDYLNFIGRHKEALTLAERLNAIDPYYPNSRMILSYFYNKKLTEANEFSARRIQIFNNYYTLDSHGFLLLNTGHYKESIEYFKKAMALEGIRYPRMLGWMGAAYAKMGEREQAMEIIREFERRLPVDKGGSISFFTAVIYSALGEKQEALAWLNKAYTNHDMEMPWLLTEPQFYNLHNEPAFKQMASEMGFDKMKPLP
ncbi:helix-turn-helix domain-containing protein [Chryseolinea lacunae]|uniref:Helix-turn-helix domain-containing protein n=1 Tax=Chryseolinea lacunae TaxID=2801331 RepID=A0ABS1L161_9BACT|nr:helix-turn-helix domain-containing protein [Chryseolinea lacunae]MBL0744667.1 helix-turn-helix domain-containing protein [Chryseolinea lacunae]